MAHGRPRDERKAQQWRRWINEWQRSGLSVQAFCAQRGLARPSFYAWRRTLEQRVAATAAFVPVQVVADNQHDYPQPAGQQPGLAFPIARLVVVFSLACGTVIDAALGKYCGKQTGENSLLRTLEPALTPGDVLLADRYYSGYFDIAFWKVRGVDVVVRLHQRRRCDLRRARRAQTRVTHRTGHPGRLP
jgi:hypothetical protein